MPDSGLKFRSRLTRATGLTDVVIDAAWPEWWSDAADASPSAVADLRFSVARQLSLDPRTLGENDEPRFLWDEAAKYKNFKGDELRERPAISAFGLSVARILIRGTPEYIAWEELNPEGVRRSILANKPFVSLTDLLALSWGLGIPVIHLRVYPLSAKRMSAMAVQIGGRPAILLAYDAQYPARLAFHLAHEIGHIALGHLQANSAVIDLESFSTGNEQPDQEEIDADRYALHLLTGNPDFRVGRSGNGDNPRQLAFEASRVGKEFGIEPGTLALCFGFETGDWQTSQAALSYIYNQPVPAWVVTNNIAKRELRWDLIQEEKANFLSAIMGGS